MFDYADYWGYAPFTPPKVRITCRTWNGTLNRNGYGVIQLSIGKKRPKLMVHILAWRLAHGRAVPRGKVLDHLCRNRACYEVTHLEPVSVRENTLRGEGPTAKRYRKRRGL